MDTKLRNKVDRKRDGKTSKVVKKVAQEFGLEWSHQPTKVLLVCNAGLTTEASYDLLFETFSPYGCVAEVRMMPGKSFSFIAFDDQAGALAAMEAVHGVQGRFLGKVLYLAYCDKMPPEPEGEGGRWRSQENWPGGLRLITDFVDEHEEELLLRSVKQENVQSDKDMKLRQVNHFGYEFKYNINNIDTDTPITPFPPSWIPVLQRAVVAGHLKVMPDQCTVNHYLPGQGIPSHVDTHSCCTEQIASISLGSDITMDFSHLSEKTSPLSVRLKTRSLLVMSDEARYAYSHGIVPRKYDIVPLGGIGPLTLVQRGTRVSFTFRKTMKGPCHCVYPQFCDSQKDKRINMDNSKAQALEFAHVHTVYEEIADHFSSTRHSPWPKVLDFIDNLPEGGLLIDVGCGNGKYLARNSKLNKIGCDYSNGLLTICRQRGFQAVRCDALRLPYRDNIADGCMSIAVIHHLSTKSRRKGVIEEIRRVLKPGGRALIYAWAQDQERDSTPSTYLRQGSKTDGGEKKVATAATATTDTDFPLVLPVHKNRTKFEHTDLLVPWKTTAKQNHAPSSTDEGSKTYHRFYHVFEEGELEELIESVDDLTIAETYYDQGNWCAIFQKH